MSYTKSNEQNELTYLITNNKLFIKKIVSPNARKIYENMSENNIKKFPIYEENKGTICLLYFNSETICDDSKYVYKDIQELSENESMIGIGVLMFETNEHQPINLYFATKCDSYLIAGILDKNNTLLYDVNIIETETVLKYSTYDKLIVNYNKELSSDSGFKHRAFYILYDPANVMMSIREQGKNQHGNLYFTKLFEKSYIFPKDVSDDGTTYIYVKDAPIGCVSDLHIMIALGWHLEHKQWNYICDIYSTLYNLYMSIINKNNTLQSLLFYNLFHLNQEQKQYVRMDKITRELNDEKLIKITNSFNYSDREIVENNYNAEKGLIKKSSFGLILETFIERLYCFIFKHGLTNFIEANEQIIHMHYATYNTIDQYQLTEDLTVFIRILTYFQTKFHDDVLKNNNDIDSNNDSDSNNNNDSDSNNDTEDYMDNKIIQKKIKKQKQTNHYNIRDNDSIIQYIIPVTPIFN